MAQVELNKAAANAGQKIIKFLVQELTAAGVWQKWSEDERQALIESACDEIEAVVSEGYVSTIANGLPAVKASLGAVTVNGEKVAAKVTFQGLDVSDRHRVIDFSNREVLVTLADSVDSAMAGMEELIDTTRELQLGLEL